jgi:hypothetical protein
MIAVNTCRRLPTLALMCAGTFFLAPSAQGQVTVASARGEISLETITDGFLATVGTDTPAPFTSTLVHGVNTPVGQMPEPGVEGGVLFISCHFENAFDVVATMAATGPADGVPPGTGTMTEVRSSVRFEVNQPTPFRAIFIGSGSPGDSVQDVRITLEPNGGNDPAIMDQQRSVVVGDLLTAGVIPPGEYRLRYHANLVAGPQHVTATVRFVMDFGEPCIADFNLDGGVDGPDVQSFFESWEAGSVLSDTNSDGGVDGSDVAAFFEVWEQGC